MKLVSRSYKGSIVSLVLLTILFFGCKSDTEFAINPSIEIERKVDSILALMTLDEKIGQMTQIRHFDEDAEKAITNKLIGSIIHTDGPAPGEDAKAWQGKFTELQKLALSTRLGIPLLFGVDAVHGQNTYNGATIFPHNIGLGATRNAELVEQIAEITAIESQATGFNWVFSPCVAIPYNEKWGRVYEAFAEDVELTANLTKASVQGHQGDLSKSNTVMATAKHYIGDGATDYGIEGGKTSLSELEISEQLMKPYSEAVKAGVGSVMASFNKVSDIPMHAHKRLITDSLKIGMGFDGIMVSDWKGYSKYGENAIIDAGIDMVMAVDGDMDDFHIGIKRGLENDSISIDRINDAVKRILRQKYRLGLFNNPFPDTTLVSKIGIKAHRDVARQAVRESMVLLKNNNQTLPLSKDLKKIVVVGEHADNAGLQSGGWTIAWQGVTENYDGATTILDGFKQQTNTEIIYDETALEQHPDADVAVIVIGETPYAEFFGDIGGEMDRYQLTLTEAHQNYINHYKNQGVKVVVILISGRPLVTTQQIEQSDAFVAAWLPGSEGHGIAEVLFGDYNFKGTLPHSWPKNEEDFEGLFGPNFWDNSIEPLFEYGFGLNY
ncbi:glycoside hydrolase family 3 protein [Paucihalobacter ruber]|nr:glycoside hydrolase family 3 N-terminal domain-containing protein [Paucihalobacter ruber]